jgi:type IV secretion system protein VirB9
MIRSAFLFACPLGLGACASAAAAVPPGAALLAAKLVAGDSNVTAPTLRSAAPARPKPVAKVGRWHDPAPPLARVDAASRAAVHEPAGSDSAGAVQVYPFADGSLYRLSTAPGRVSDIALQPGETLISVAAGDTARWVIGNTISGSGASQRTHVLVKPSAAGLATNLLIATDRRVYRVEIESDPRAAMASISWTYPEDALLALRVRQQAAQERVAAGVAVEALNFDYRIEGDRPEWRPLRVFDDGHQVFIEFPPALADGEAPPLFVTGEGGRAELVNYRVRGRYYVVDRLFTAAQLRLGEGRQQVVRIIRDGGPRAMGRS